MVQVTLTHEASPRAAHSSTILRILAVIGAWGERRRQRRALAELGPHLLHDLGLSPGDAWAEARKPFWRR